jgi:iron-sulfur cluster repair protein YtfE (RIC family)
MSSGRGENRSSTGRYRMLMLGAAGGAILGRLLPVLVSNVSGMIRAAAGQDPFAGLIREHRLLLSLLQKMEETPTEKPLRRTALFYRFKRTLAKHALAEEDIVYPLLKDDAQRGEATRKLYEEHSRIKVLLFELNRSIADDGWYSRVRDLRNEIEPHARQEEEVEFPELRRRMDKPEAMDLSRRIRQEESLVV